MSDEGPLPQGGCASSFAAPQRATRLLQGWQPTPNLFAFEPLVRAKQLAAATVAAACAGMRLWLAATVAAAR
ncbi:hypothetical protein Tco_1071506, partial [Tanacetum coccineum]